MDLKKLKKRQKKHPALKVEYKPPKKIIGLHVYRSEDKDAPLSEWTRLTDKPVPEGSFKDKYSEEDKKKDFFYKFTEVDDKGNESEPKEPEFRNWLDKDDKPFEQTPAETIIGHNVYWSVDPDLPLEQWTPYNDRMIKDDSILINDPVEVPFYVYITTVNALGNEFGKPSAIQRLVPQV